MGDLNGDGASDILSRSPSTGSVDGWVMQHGNWFASVPLGTFDPAWRLAGTDDVGHGAPGQMFWTNPATGGFSAWLVASA